jgi:methanogenic corrinoid protein MtbC1
MITTVYLENRIAATCELMKSKVYLERARFNPQSFTRSRKMNFYHTTCFILKNAKKSLQVSLNEYMKEIKNDKETISKQAYSKQRQNIRPEAILELFNTFTHPIYDCKNIASYKGFRVSAIDGIVYDIPNTPELREYFGYCENDGNQYARAQGSGLYDITNGIFIDIQFTHYLKSEKELAFKHIDKLCEIGLKNDVILFDRGYASRELIAKLYEENIHFVIRCNSKFIKQVNESKNNEIINYTYNNKKCSLRVIKFLLPSGEIETLITDIFDENFTTQEFKELYAKRWCVESKYDNIKNKLQIENYSGVTPIAILQDFYATMFLSNVIAIAQLTTDAKIIKRQKGKNLKYEHKTNVNVLIGTIKDEVIHALLEPSERKRAKKFRRLLEQASKYSVSIRPNRSFPHSTENQSEKFHQNQKSPF